MAGNRTAASFRALRKKENKNKSKGKRMEGNLVDVVEI